MANLLSAIGRIVKRKGVKIAAKAISKRGTKVLAGAALKYPKVALGGSMVKGYGQMAARKIGPKGVKAIKTGGALATAGLVGSKLKRKCPAGQRYNKANGACE